MKVSVVMIVRNEADIIATTIRYHRANGVDEVLVADNGSTDGTADVLERMHRRDPAVRWTSRPGPFRQSEIISGLAREAAAGGADWILPTDADEFWWSPEPLRAVLERRHLDTAVGALQCEVVPFAQDRRVRRRRAGALRTMRWRPEHAVPEATARPEIMAHRLSFLELRYPPKHAVRASDSLVISAGAHHVEGHSGAFHAVRDLMLLHAPIRSRAQMAARVEVGERVHAIATDQDEGWHARRLMREAESGRLDAEWASCSVRDGSLQLEHTTRPVVADDRLARAVDLHIGGMGWTDRLDRAVRRQVRRILDLRGTQAAAPIAPVPAPGSTPSAKPAG